MSVRETLELDQERIEALIEQEEGALEPKHRASIEFKRVVAKTVAGGVASSWQDSPPHAVFIDRGQGNRIWDIDGNEYVDYHLGYGAMVVGHAHPKVVEAVVVPRTDEIGLVKVEAWIVLRDGTHASDLTAQEIRAFCKSKLAPYKYPRWINFVDGLPRTTTGKIQRFKLRASPHDVAGGA